jgi:hypothetical protein
LVFGQTKLNGKPAAASIKFVRGIKYVLVSSLRLPQHPVCLWTDGCLAATRSSSAFEFVIAGGKVSGNFFLVAL